MTQAAVIPALLELCCLLLSLPGVMRETDLPNLPQPPGVKRTLARPWGGRAEPGICWALCTPSTAPWAPPDPPSSATSHPSASLCQGPAGMATAAFGHSGSARSQGHLRASPGHFLSLILPQAIPEHPSCASCPANKLRTGQGSLYSTPIRAQGSAANEIQPRPQGRVYSAALGVFLSCAHSPH